MDFENDLYAATAQAPEAKYEYVLSDQQKRGTVLFFAITIIAVLIFSFCGTGESLKSFCGRLLFCSCRKFFRREGEEEGQDQDQDQYVQDRAFAETLQRRLNEEERQRERMLKRKERRMWYEYYMRPWTMVVEKSDLLHARGEDDVATKTMESKLNQTLKAVGGPLLDSESEEEISGNADKAQPLQCRVCDEDEENATLYLNLPRLSRCVDGTCTFCLDEYVAGDEVVWSDLECPHVFHKECLMEWLSKGKKRCPICRHWFVPGAKIDDQKQSHGETWQRALAEMKRREKEEKEKHDFEQDKAEIESRTIPPTTPESLHISSDHNELACTLSRDDSRNSEHPDGFELIDIESHGTILMSEMTRRSEAYDASGEKNVSEGKNERQISFMSEVFLGEE